MSSRGFISTSAGPTGQQYCWALGHALTTEQIAANLNLSTKTVQNYHYMVKAKTGLHTDAQLVRLAVACGLTNL